MGLKFTANELEQQMARVRGLLQTWKAEYRPDACEWDALTVIGQLETALGDLNDEDDLVT